MVEPSLTALASALDAASPTGVVTGGLGEASAVVVAGGRLMREAMYPHGGFNQSAATMKPAMHPKSAVATGPDRPPPPGGGA
jgi:hypothetical protein